VQVPSSVRSTNGVTLALHDLGGQGPAVLLCHATGFHGRAYGPFAAYLSAAYHVYALDFRGHGASTPPDDEEFDWGGMAQDVLACVEAIGIRPIPAIGHSMGGAAILLAELSHPGTFSEAYVYEPIVRSAAWDIPNGENPMSGAARRRREVFDSRAEVMWRYCSRAPLGELRADCLAAYVEHGFVDLADGGVRLACRAEHEARTFESSGLMTTELCANITIPVVVGVGGADSGSNTGLMAPATAAALPYGRLRSYPHLGHFGPLQDPVTVAVEVREAFGAAGA